VVPVTGLHSSPDGCTTRQFARNNSGSFTCSKWRFIVSIIRIGSNDKYSSGWDSIFAKGKKTIAAKPAGKKKSAGKKSAKTKAAKKK
jgi:hypothetical protein